MSGSRTKLIIHIGQHKTGSKALQSFLAKHTAGLQQHGVLYPVERSSSRGNRAYANSHYRLFALLRREAMVAAGQQLAAAGFWLEQRRFCRPFGSAHEMFEALEARRAQVGATTIVVSAEDLFDMSSAHELDASMALIESGATRLASLAETFRYEPIVVAYLRRQDHLLGAHYAQYIKGSATNDVDFASFAEAFAPRLRTRDILAPWASAFGPERIRVHCYEPSALPFGIVPDFFEHILGFSVPAAWTPPRHDAESVNATVDRDQIEFIRALNRRNAQGLPVCSRQDVLNAAFAADTSHHQGVAAWLAPHARRALLQTHDAGNEEIAARFGVRDGKALFAEPVPKDDETWREYPGLSTERELAIAANVRAATARRRRATMIRMLTLVALIVLCALTCLGVVAGLHAALR